MLFGPPESRDMARIIDNQKDPSCLFVGTLTDELADKAIKKGDASFMFEQTEKLGHLNTERSDINPRFEPLIGVPNTHASKNG